MAVRDRERALQQALSDLGFKPVAKPASVRLGMLPPDGKAAVMDLYFELGEVQDHPALRPGGWDLSLANGFVVELDELQPPLATKVRRYF